jgi:ribonuclease P/MRP protein subunit RPP40
VDNQLKFDGHIESQVKKANRLLGLIRRSFHYLDNETFCLLYKSLVRPHLEYGHVVYYPRYERQVALLEGVQRRGTKMVSDLRDLPYSERLRRLDLPSLVHRRKRGDLIEAYKYLHGKYKVEPCPFHC